MLLDVIHLLLVPVLLLKVQRFDSNLCHLLASVDVSCLLCILQLISLSHTHVVLCSLYLTTNLQSLQVGYSIGQWCKQSLLGAQITRYPLEGIDIGKLDVIHLLLVPVLLLKVQRFDRAVYCVYFN